jgi:hypothetical protein
MKKNTARSNRALVAVVSLILAGIVSADLLGQLRAGNDYNTPLALTVIITATALAVTLFTVNVVTYRKR